MKELGMRSALTIAAVALSLSGCGVASREAGYPGGNVGFLADRYSLFASGQQQVVNRYLVSLALVAPLVEATVTTSSEARLTAERINELYKKISALEAASKICPLKIQSQNNGYQVVQNCESRSNIGQTQSAFTFESLSYEVNTSLSRALGQAYDNLGINSNLSNTTAINGTEILNVLRQARRFAPILVRYLATFRDVSVIVGSSVYENCDKESADKKLCDNLNAALGQLVTRTRTASFDVAKDEVPIRAVLNESRAVLNKGLLWELSTLHRNALLQHVNRSCERLDALARIEDPGFDGCEVSLDGEPTEAPELVRDAVNKILEPTTSN